MPNQRKKNQKMIGTYVSDKVAVETKLAAKEAGLTVADYVRRLIAEENLRRKTNNANTDRNDG